MTYRTLATAVVFCLSFAAVAEVYKTVDEDGKVIFTDNPRGKKHVEKVDLPPVNSQPALQVPERPKNTEHAPNFKPVLLIKSPQQGAQIPTGQYEIPVSISARPALKDGQTIQMLINGEPFGTPQTSTEFVLKDVFRGAHQLSAQLRSPKGAVIATSASVTIFVQRHRVAR